MRSVVQETMLTFDRGRGEISEETDGHFQNISFLQFGVACVVFANQRKNQTFQVTETVVDTSTSSLLQQRFKSLEEMRRSRYSAALLRVKQKKINSNINSFVFLFPLPFSVRWLVFSGPRWTWQ